MSKSTKAAQKSRDAALRLEQRMIDNSEIKLGRELASIAAKKALQKALTNRKRQRGPW